MLMALVIYNVPLDHVDSTLQSGMSIRCWLLMVNETNSKQAAWRPAEVKGKRWHNLSDEEISEHDEGSTVAISKIEERASSSKAVASQNLLAYGFGIWGWCEWSSTNLDGYAKCTKKAAYRLPDITDNSSHAISQKTLPYMVATVLSGVSIPLVFTPIPVFLFLLSLVFTLGFPGPYPEWPVPRRNPEKAKEHRRTRVAWWLRNMLYHGIFSAIMFFLNILAIAFVLAGWAYVNNDKNNGLKAELGLGFSLLVTAWIFVTIAQSLCLWKSGLHMRGGKKLLNKSES
ncbi:hypothetical protein L204_101163 [Cryptococcus depauperatus]|nr:hypothetical protein L204_00905 [Cryptococcus depauperatus CBS 7855]